MVTTEEGLWIGGAILLALVYFPSVNLFTKYRDSPQVYNRSYLSVTTSVTGMTIFGILGCLAYAINGPGICGGTIVPQYFGLYLHFTFQIERCILLIASYQIAVQAREYALKRHDADLAVEISRLQKKTPEVPELQSLEKKDSDDMGYLLKNRHLFQHSFKSPSKIAAFAAACVLEMIVIAIVATDVEGTLSDRGSAACTKLQSKISSMNNVILAICVLLLLECARRISKVKENFWIKQEMRNVGILALVCLVIVLAAAVVKSLSGLRPIALFYIGVPLGEMLFSFINVVKLVRKEDKSERTRTDKNNSGGGQRKDSATTPSQRNEHVGPDSTSVDVVAAHFGVDTPSGPTPSGDAASMGASSVTSTGAAGSENISKNTGKRLKKSPQDKLRDVMENEKLNAAFEQFMVQEFAIENVYFLRAVERFEKQFEVPMREDQYEFAWDAARMIFVRFCAQNAKLAVNISATTQKQLASVLETRSSNSPKLNTPIDPELFLRAKKEIIELVCMDSLRRFHNSPLYAAARPVNAIAEV